MPMIQREESSCQKYTQYCGKGPETVCQLDSHLFRAHKFSLQGAAQPFLTDSKFSPFTFKTTYCNNLFLQCAMMQVEYSFLPWEMSKFFYPLLLNQQ